MIKYVGIAYKNENELSIFLCKIYPANKSEWKTSLENLYSTNQLNINFKKLYIYEYINIQ